MVKKYKINYKGIEIEIEQLENGKFRKPDFVKQLSGSFGGMQVKPSVEVILVVMKPLSEKTYVDQALSNGKGAVWMDDCRIPYKNTNDFNSGHRENALNYNLTKDDGIINFIPSNKRNLGSLKGDIIKGRFPANLLVQDDVLNDGKNHKSGKLLTHHKRSGKSNLEKTFEIRDRTGEYANLGGDEGSFSRYFDLDAWTTKNGIKDTFPFLITPKPSRAEKEMGCEHLKKNKKYTAGNYSQSPICSTCDKTLNGINDHSECNGEVYYKDMESSDIANNHPTVKPIKLMSYLVTLGSRKEDIIFDPFCGSGTTCIAAKLLNRKWIGVEIGKDNYKIAKTRIENIDVQLDLFN